MSVVQFDLVDSPWYYILPDSNTPDGPTFRVDRIRNPDVRRRKTPYAQIRFAPGDKVTILEAGGCVQTGGWGDTWKRYVDPRPARENKHYGMIQIGGAMPDLVRISTVLGQTFTIPAGVPSSERYLSLGYMDGEDDYGDNGYDDRDDGTDEQCKGRGNAYVIIRVELANPGIIVAPQSILTIQQPTIPAVTPSGPNWAGDLVGNETWMSFWDPPLEWTPVQNSDIEFETPLVGLAGNALLPNISDKDNPFAHPFGKPLGYDYEFFVAPDPQFNPLLASSNSGRTPSGEEVTDSEYDRAVTHAKQDLKLEGIEKVAGVETDQDGVHQVGRKSICRATAAPEDWAVHRPRQPQYPGTRHCDRGEGSYTLAYPGDNFCGSIAGHEASMAGLGVKSGRLYRDICPARCSTTTSQPGQNAACLKFDQPAGWLGRR